MFKRLGRIGSLGLQLNYLGFGFFYLVLYIAHQYFGSHALPVRYQTYTSLALLTAVGYSFSVAGALRYGPRIFKWMLRVFKNKPG